MSSKNNFWKVSKLFALAVIAAAFSSSLSQAIEVQKQAIAEPTIKERLSKIREALKHRKAANADKYYSESSSRETMRMKENKPLLSQWNNYWSDWTQRKWSDWDDWDDWDDQSSRDDWSDWDNWSDWDDWDNWSNWGNWF